MWALTIAGGRGERLQPLTNDICKPMVPVNGLPLLAASGEVALCEWGDGHRISDWLSGGAG